jgi:phosphatidate cytidylyltransferase
MNLELKKRIFTSVLLICLLILMYFYNFVLVVCSTLIAVIAWIEFVNMINRIFLNKSLMNKIFSFLSKGFFFIYLISLIYLVFDTQINSPHLVIFVIYSILISIMTDIGGLVVGKTFGGRKLTNISPKKTISGAIGSLVFSLFLVPIFTNQFTKFNILDFVIITVLISLTSQIGDLFISFLKRKSKLKNTSDILPGHGGILDRIDGIIFSIPIGFLLLSIF